MKLLRIIAVLVVAFVAVLQPGSTGFAAAEDASGEKFEFQAEVSRLMDIIINSLYQKKEIFLRELVSNGCDALDKIRFLSLQDGAALGEGDNKELEMRINFDEEERTLTIRDRGIGMTRQDLIENLGTVAKSGTTNFVEQLAEGGDLSLIGQFGVGFYSVYLVADKVQVTSKHNEDDQYIWESTADSTFSVAKDPQGNTLGRGTEIKLFLKEDALEYTDQDKLEQLLNRYSQFITFPIYLHKKTVETVEIEDEDEDEDVDDGETEGDDEEDDDELEAEDEDDDDDSEPKTKEVTTWTWARVNEQAAIWTRSPEDVTDEEYKEFYKTISKDASEPSSWIHFKAEGEIEFKSILYIPERPPYDLYNNYYSTSNALKLYVRKVLINDNFEELMPRYLNFITGVVDSDDLPLSVSRETLQQHKAVKVMSKKLIRKALDMLRKMAQAEKSEDDDSEEEEDDSVPSYSDFFNKFGKNIKLGVVEDSTNRARLAKLVRFKSTKSEGLVGLQDYIENMPEWQKNIYYIAGESLEALKASPFLERAEAKGVEVLLMDDPVDEYCVQNLPEFEGVKLQSLTKEGLQFGDETDDDKKLRSLYKEKFKPLTKWLKELLGGKVEKVTVSNRVTNTPAVLVTGQFGHSANMERIMKAQAFGDNQRMAMMAAQKTMEVNPRHPIVAELAKLSSSEEETDLEEAKNIAWLMYDTSVVSSGFDMESPKEFAARMYTLMQSGLKLDSLELLPELDVPDDPEPEEDAAADDKEEL